MTLVKQPVLNRLRPKQNAQEMQQAELSARVKIRTQIKETLSKSKLTDPAKMDIFEQAQEKYGTFKELVRHTKTKIVVEAGTAPASIDVTPSEAPMFQAVNLPGQSQEDVEEILQVRCGEPGSHPETPTECDGSGRESSPRMKH